MKTISKSLIPVLLSVSAATACDLCNCYTPPKGGSDGELGLHVSIAEQFTRFGTLQFEGDEVANPSGQYLNSSITQIIVGRSFLDQRLDLQLGIPLIYREYRRPEGFAIDEGTESGLGDISLIARYELLRRKPAATTCPMDPAHGGKSGPSPRADTDASWSLLAGIKLPTGDSSRLKEEFHEVEVPGAPESGIHGHDLALGSGSVDGILGTEVSLRRGDWFFQGDCQYALRGEGRHSYRYANDFTWSAGPGWYAVRGATRSIALQFAASGETKGTDTFQGSSAGDTGITAVYLGPRLLASYGTMTGEIGFDLPVMMHNTELQAVPDYRIRAAFTLRF